MKRFGPALGLIVIVGGCSTALFACGDDDNGTSIPTPDGGTDAAHDSSPGTGVDSSTVDQFVPPSDSGSDANETTDASADADAGDAAVDCTSLQIASINPVQGYNGIDIVVQIAGSGFAPCTAGAACADQFTLTTCDLPSNNADAGDAGDAGDADAAQADSGACATTINLTTLSSDGNVATVRVPAGAQLGGPYNIIDRRGACAAELKNAYTTLPASASITVTKVTPVYGWTGDDTPVTIIGTGFVSTPTAYIQVPGATPEWTKIKNVAFTSSTSITGVIPKGLAPTPAGPKYSIAVLNSDGQGNTLTDAFRVVANPTPSISTVAPSALTTSQLGTADNVTITGCNFRAPLTVETVSSTGTVVAETAGAPACTGAATCPGGTNVCTLKATIAAGLATGPYLVRLTDTDDGTSTDYATLVVTAPSAKLDTGFATSTNHLNTPRRSLVTAAARINDASRFLYAIGGEQADNTVLDTIEVAPLDLFGTLGAWKVQRNKLSTPRSGAAVAQIGKFIYVIGGTSTFATNSGTGGAAPTGTPLATIERAKLLDATDIPTLSDPTTTSTGSLAAGSWYYRVAAVRDLTDPDNKDGETLASDEVVGSIGFKGSIVLKWSPPSNATHILKYRIYRTPTVNGKSGDEVFLTDTADAATMTYTDDGSMAPGSSTPLPRGSTGTWNTVGAGLAHARLNATATIAQDPAGAAYIYVLGGWGKCDGTGVDRLMGCYELATISPDGETLGAFAAGANSMQFARMRHGAASMNADNGITPWTGGVSFITVAGGAGPANVNQSIEVTSVGANGALATFTSQTNPQPRDGTQLMAANGYFYQFGGATSGTYTTGNVLSNVTAQTATTITLANWSNAVSTLTTARGRMGATLESAFFYFVGGTSDDANALDTVEQIIY